MSEREPFNINLRQNGCGILCDSNGRMHITGENIGISFEPKEAQHIFNLMLILARLRRLDQSP